MSTQQATNLATMKQRISLAARWSGLGWAQRSYTVLGVIAGSAMVASVTAALMRTDSRRLVWWLDGVGPKLALLALASTLYAFVQIVGHVSAQRTAASRKVGYAAGHTLLFGCASLLAAFLGIAMHGDLLGDAHKSVWTSPKGDHTAHIYEGWFDVQSVFVTRDSNLVVHKLGTFSADRVEHIEWIDEEHMKITDEEGDVYYYDVAGGSDQDGEAPMLSAAERTEAMQAADLAKIAAETTDAAESSDDDDEPRGELPGFF